MTPRQIDAVKIAVKLAKPKREFFMVNMIFTVPFVICGEKKLDKKFIEGLE